MFEIKMKKAAILKKIIESLKDLVSQANLEVAPEGMSLQAMDSSHVSLVGLALSNKDGGFEHYRCDRNITLGINLVSMAKILKCAQPGDSLTLTADDEGDEITFAFESEARGQVSEFKLKLMDIDSEHLGIPDSDPKCVVKLPSGEFQRICRDMQIIGDSITIAVNKEGVKFSVLGDLGSGSITCRQTTAMDKEKQEQVVIDCVEEISQQFALRYLNFFTKATPLSSKVIISMSPDTPLVVEYEVSEKRDREEDEGSEVEDEQLWSGLGSIRYFLAPKIEEE
eukprot:29452_1